MYYIPCNYVLLNGWIDRHVGPNFRRDNIELSRVTLILTLPSAPSITKLPSAGLLRKEDTGRPQLGQALPPSSPAFKGL